MISTPIPGVCRSTKASSTPRVPPDRPCISRNHRVASIHSWSRSPAWPNGASRLTPSPVPKPSREMAKLWTRTRDISVAPWRSLGAARRSVVVAAGAGADSRHVRAVDVARDRGLLAGVVDAVDVARRREAADIADVVVARPDRVEVGVEQLLVLDALDDAEHAPRDVVVDARELAGPPDESDDRERPVGLDVQRMTGVAVR